MIKALFPIETFVKIPFESKALSCGFITWIIFLYDDSATFNIKTFSACEIILKPWFVARLNIKMVSKNKD